MKRRFGITAAAAAVACFSLAASANAAEVTTSPNSLDFGNQATGTSSATRTASLTVPCHMWSIPEPPNEAAL